MNKALFLSFAALAVACGSADKEDTSSVDTQPSSEPASAPTASPATEPQEVLLYYTSKWSGEWTVADGALSGTEQLLSSGFQESQGVVGCISVWNLVGTAPTAPACQDCVWEFEVTATGDIDASTFNADDCSVADASFSYAYTTNYEYNGEALGDALLYSEGEDFGAFVLPNNPNAPAVDTYESGINWDEATGVFSYSSGYVDYEYIYTY